jgi:hypothetical protein
MTKATTAVEVPKIYAAMNAVHVALAANGIAKGREFEQGKTRYNFRGIDDVYNAVSSELAEKKILVRPGYSNRACVERKAASGNALFYVTVEGMFRFVSAEDGSEMEVGPFFGEAMDTSDKGTTKAMSVAQRTAVIQTFCIPTEGEHKDPETSDHNVVASDDERAAEERGKQPIRETDIEIIRKEFKELGIDEAKFLGILGVKKIEDITNAMMVDVKQGIAKKRARTAPANDPQAKATGSGK